MCKKEERSDETLEEFARPDTRLFLDFVMRRGNECLRLTVSLKDAEKLAAGDVLDLGDAVRISEDHTDLRGGKTLLGELADELGDFRGSDL
jgi:hypothetical protein